MRLSVLLAAAGLATGALAPALDAQTVTRTTTTVTTSRTGPAYRHHGRRVCRTRYFNHRQVRRCFYR